MNTRNENFNSWTWGIAAGLLLALLWLWIIGKGPSSSANCCGRASASAAAASAASSGAASTSKPAPASVLAASAQAAPVSIANTVTTATTLTPAPTPAPAATTKPKATLYFNVGKTSAPADSGKLIADVVTYLQKNTASKAVISGFNDPSGDAAQNAEISKNRAKSARDVLIAAGIDESRIELRKPQVTTQTGDPKQARRVEISIEP